MKRLFRYLNPIAHLGDMRYSIVFPLCISLLSAVLLEAYAYRVVHDPDFVNLFAIILFIAYIVYFSFREGIRGGLTATGVTIAYYAYIIYTRHQTSDQLATSIDTTIFLAILYILISGTIGWLKQTIDQLLDREMDEKKRLQTIIQQLPVGVIITDRAGVVVQVNKSLERILGVTIPYGFVVGKDMVLETKHKGVPFDPSQSPLLSVLSTGKPVTGEEYQLKRKDGKTAYIRTSAAAIHNKSGTIIAAASIVHDITEQKEIEDRKDDFVNMASHELKTPLTSLKLYVDSLQARLAKAKDERTTVILTNVQKQLLRLQKLVDDLLDVSRLQTGKLSFNKKTFRLDELIVEAIEALQGSAKKQKIVFVKKSAITVYADRFRIYQVLTNIVTNALKYSGEGKRINIRLYKEDNKAVVEVQDFGIGIDKDKLKKVFHRLYQVTDDKEKTFPGFGMGLYIAREIIKYHKGSISVESKKAVGSTFYFRLPLDTKIK